MVKLCRACGYINRDDALECEECHSLFDDKLNSIVNNNNNIEDNSFSNEEEYKPTEIISMSDILKMNNEDVISDQNQYTPIENQNNIIDNPIYQNYEDTNNKEEEKQESYVTDFLYSKTGESEDFDIDENQLLVNTNQNFETDDNDYASNEVSNFLYSTSQEDQTSYETNNDYEDFDQTSVSDFLYGGNSQSQDDNEESKIDEVELDENFDAEAPLTNILYGNSEEKEIIEDSNYENNDSHVEIKPFDIIYNDKSESKDVSNFLYTDEENIIEDSSKESITEETTESNILEEEEISNSDYYNIVTTPADADEEANTVLQDTLENEQVTNENQYDNAASTDVIKEIDVMKQDENESESVQIEEVLDTDINQDVLSKDESDTNKNINEFDVLSNDEPSINKENIETESNVQLDEEYINNAVNEELKDATYMENLDISSILSYDSSIDENDSESTLEDNTKSDNADVDSTKTGLLDTLKQIFSFTSTNSKELSKDEIQKEYDKEVEIEDEEENETNNNSIKVEDKAETPRVARSASNPSGFNNIKPMEIKRRNTESVSKVHDDDTELEDALKVFESAGTIKKDEEEEKETPKTVVYDLNSPKENKETVEIKSAVPSSEEEKSKKTKKLINKKAKEKRVLTQKQTFIRRSIVLSAVVACVVIAIVVISRVNKEKELNAYASRLAANNDVSYEYLYNSLLEKGYSEDESFKAIEALNIDFADNALNIIYTAAKDSNKLSSKETVRALLESKGFANSEIEKAMSSAEWDKYLLIYIDACISKTKELDKKTIIKTIEDAKFTTTEVEYVKRNADWPKLAKKNLSTYLADDELHTKEEAKKHLEDLGYSEQDIKTTSENYEWDVYAYQYLTKYLQQKEEEGVAIESSRITYTKILEDAKFDEEDIELVMGRFDFASYAKSKTDTIINEGSDFVDKKKVQESLEKEGYTKEEIESALKETDWNATAIASLKSLDNRKLSKKEMIQKLTDAGYSENEIAYVNKNYDWRDQGSKYIEFLNSENKNGNEEHLRSILTESGYSSDEVDKLIFSLSLDYFTNAAKEDIKEISADTDFSRKKAKKFLSELNYGDTEINAVLNYLRDDWNSAASRYIKGLNVNSKAEARKALQNADFTSTEIEYALTTISSSNWTLMCIDYAKAIYNENDADTRCLDFNKYKKHEETSIAQTLKNGEYSNDDIETALSTIFAKTPEGCIVE